MGDYLNAHFVSAFQKVGSFRLANGQKQGGNVAGYFCTADGRVLHVVAGPGTADVLLREARWVHEAWKLALLERKGGDALKSFFGKAHAERLRSALGASMNGPGRHVNARPADTSALWLRQAHAQPLDRQGRVHLLLAQKPLPPIESVYRVVFENILGEPVTTDPVEVRRP